MVNDLSSSVKAVWELSLVLQAVLLATLVARGLHRRYPLFCLYLSLNLLQSLTLLLVYPVAGFGSRVAWMAGWSSHGIVVVAKAVAIGELCYGVLARYRGIWAMGWRLLALCGISILVIAIGLGRHDFAVLVLTLDLGAELAIATVITGLFLFSKYYEVPIKEPLRALGLGFFIYSCVHVLNNLVLERFMKPYTDVWNLIGSLTYTMTIAVWIYGCQKAAPESKKRPEMLDADVYASLIPALNRGLDALNKGLSSIWPKETHRT